MFISGYAKTENVFHKCDHSDETSSTVLSDDATNYPRVVTMHRQPALSPAAMKFMPPVNYRKKGEKKGRIEEGVK